VVAFGRTQHARFRRLAQEFAKFAVIGVAGVFVTNGVYDLLYLHHGVGPVLSATIATVVAAVGTYLGNRYWSFRSRQRASVWREVSVFAVLNGVGLLIQDATVAFNYYLLGLGHNKLAVFCALNLGIALATLFRFWSYRRFVWDGSSAPSPRQSPATPAGQHART
jgi:putative flippase GtrA